MPDNLDRYLPEFDENEQREHLSAFERSDLIDMLIRAYKEKRVFAKLADEYASKLTRIQATIEEPSTLTSAPGIPGDDDLRRMIE